MSSINLLQLANHLGLSKSTVSRALRDSYEISLATRQKVQQAAKELNYQPNPYASGLRKHVSKTIAVVLPQVENNLFATIIKGIHSVAQQRDYHVLLYLTYDDPELEAGIFRFLQSGRVDGVILSVVSKDDQVQHIKDMMASGKPVIFIDRISEQIEATKITTNDLESSFQATELLIKKGCRKIVFLYVLRDFSIGKRRFEGYKKALEHYQIPFDETLVLKCSQDYDNNYQLLKQLLEERKDIDGILSPVEKMAITSYFVCDELKIAIPEKIKIASYTNLSFASLLSPALTTIVPPGFEMGKMAATLMLNSFEKKKFALKNEEIILPASICERMSTAEGGC